MRSQSGVTLIELVTSMAIAATLAAVATPSLARMMTHHHTHARVATLTGSLNSARIAAISLRTPVTMCPSADGLTCRTDSNWSEGWLTYQDPHRQNQPQSAQAILTYTHNSAAAVNVHSSLARQRVRYQPTGWSSGTNLTLRACDAAGALLAEVIVNNAGRVRSQRPTRSGAQTTAACPQPNAH